MSYSLLFKNASVSFAIFFSKILSLVLELLYHIIIPNKDSRNEEAPNKELTYVEKVWYAIAIFVFLVVIIV